MDVKLSPGPFLHQLKGLNLSNGGSQRNLHTKAAVPESD